ncbi:Ig-like domain-containing protein [Mycobacterium sp. IDR2000157661]|uniref:Ig-like domain-containing protein n=1 Tax=Mycobacterium sp. IDR2000157661 TaxID=2867005 RepID=UPI001EEACB7C|nr:VCBS domain-containing protein [Mycobacterium sp. IDR2000157661]ULE33599.1 VCBS domain-containing protein [Mycobacterium sp. IDR2000157661]
MGQPNPNTGAVTGSLNFTDPDGNPLTYTVPTQPASGTVTVTTNGTYTYTPTQAARDAAATPQGAKTATFTVVASDGKATASVNVTVNILPTPGINTAPVVTGVTYGDVDPSTGAITGTVNATDANGDQLSFSLSGAQPAGGTLVVSSNGAFTFTPSASARLAAGLTSGPDTVSFAVTVTDGTATTTTNVAVPISPVNLTKQPSATTGDSPYGVAVVGNRAYVANQGTNTVSVIDMETGAVLGEITVGSAPTNMVASPDGTRLYVTNRSSNSVSVINTTTNTVVGGQIAVGATPESITVSSDGTRLYVANFGSHTVSVINTTLTTPAVVATVAVGYNPRGIAFAQTVNGPRVYVANQTSSSVSVINASTNQIVGGQITVGSTPLQVAVSSDGTRAYVTNYWSSSVSVIDTATNSVNATITVAAYPVGVALSADGSVLYVASNFDEITVVNTQTRTTITTIQLDSSPEYNFHMVAVAPDGSLAVTDLSDSQLRIIDYTRGQTVTVSTNQPNSTTGVVTGQVAADPDDGTLTYTTTTPGYGTVVVNTNGTFTYTPSTVGRQVARITPGEDTDSFSVTVTNGKGASQTVQVTVTLVPVDVTGADTTAALQAVLNNLKTGDTLTLAPGTYRYSNLLRVNASGVTIDGNGAMLYATNPALASFQILGNNVTLKNLNLHAPVGASRQDGTNQSRLLFGGTGNVISDVNVVGSASAGIYIVGAKNFRVERVTVSDTAADGIQITGGSSNGQLNNATVSRTGDDSIAVVSYNYDSGPVTDIVINNATVIDNLQARGIAVVGGERITINNFTVNGSSQAGLFIGSQGGLFNTRATKDITVNGGTISRSNTATFFPFGAIMVLSQNPGVEVSNVTIRNVTINQPTLGQTHNITVATAGNALTWDQALAATPQGTLSNITFENIAIVELFELPVFFSNAQGTYTATGFTMNGRPITINTTA